MQLFISWCEGIEDNKSVLTEIKNSKIIDGIETSNLDNTIDKIQNFGLKVSIHNPFREHGLGLGNPDLKDSLERIPEISLVSNKSDPDSVGFHLIGKKDFSTNRDEVITQILENLKYMQTKISKNVLFECRVLGDWHRNSEFKEITDFLTSYLAVEKILKHSDTDYLFDISHFIVSRYNSNKFKNRETNFNQELDKFLNSCNGRIKQLHVNVPHHREESGYNDIHDIFKDNHQSKIVEEILRKIMKSISKNNLLVTLEMDPKVSLEEFPKVMIKQAKYFRRLTNNN